MKGIIVLAAALGASLATAFSGNQHVAFERNNAVYVTNLDGTGREKDRGWNFPSHLI